MDPEIEPSPDDDDAVLRAPLGRDSERCREIGEIVALRYVR